MIRTTRKIAIKEIISGAKKLDDDREFSLQQVSTTKTSLCFLMKNEFTVY